MQSHIGEMAALATAICWTINAIAFESAGKKVGSMSVNYIRLFIAFFLLGICSLPFLLMQMHTHGFGF